MESLSETVWDIVISGTGLPQSLLALALSRSGKKLLHLDKNDYYGGPEAALSLQDAEAWVKAINQGNGRSIFRDARLELCERDDDCSSKLSFSRAYSLSLSPQLIYTRSLLLPTLVASKVYRQLEFLAVGSWWLYDADEKNDLSISKGLAKSTRLRKIPGSREDVFADRTIDPKSKRSLMSFLRPAADPTAQSSLLGEWGDKSFQEFLTSNYGIPQYLQAALHALTLSPQPPSETLTSYALPRINRHLTSVGLFGPGFGAVIPKWGGIAEVTQVACRAGAVGGGVYVLDKTIKEISGIGESLTVKLQDEQIIRTSWIAGCDFDLPTPPGNSSENDDDHSARMIAIISSPLSKLFPITTEGAPLPAGAVVVYPAQSPENPPAYLLVHSSEAGECPIGQSVVYCSIALPPQKGHKILTTVLGQLLAVVEETPRPAVLWSLRYSQRESTIVKPVNDAGSQISGGVIRLPQLSSNLAFDDSILHHVRQAWQRVTKDEEGFMQFSDRQDDAYDDDD